MKVPDEAYYGAHTARSLANFRISGEPFDRNYLIALAKIKLACSRANTELGRLEPGMATAIATASLEVIEGRHWKEFPIDVFQAGSGTSTNMNMNEVIANRASEIMGKGKGGKAVHPNDHVNMGQSTNDATPTAIRMALAHKSAKILESVSLLESSLTGKAGEFMGILKAGRTHLQDAVPMTLGQEFGAYASAISKHKKRIGNESKNLLELPLGGNAIGTGINNPKRFRELVVAKLSEIDGLDYRPSDNGVEGVQFLTDIAAFSSCMKVFAIDLNKIANDLRVLSSGPRTGLGEITLPALEPGSSIMPGKVNPSMAEAVNMACMQVMGNDTAVQIACSAGQLELNTHMPLIARNSIQSAELIENAAREFALKCVSGIRANREKCAWYVNNSAALATALNPALGYDRAAGLVKESLATGKGIRELLKEKKLLSEKQISELLDPQKLTGTESKK